MADRNPQCVFIAQNMAQAVVVANWLNNNGIAAEVMDLMTLGGLEGLTPYAPNISTRGIEIWVDNLDQIPQARELIAQHESSHAEQEAQRKNRGPLKVRCAECGTISEFPGQQDGTVQSCPHCNAYLDVEDATTKKDQPNET